MAKRRRKKIGATLSPALKGDAKDLFTSLVIGGIGLWLAFKLTPKKDNTTQQNTAP